MLLMVKKKKNKVNQNLFNGNTKIILLYRQICKGEVFILKDVF